MVLEMLVFSTLKHFTRLVAREKLITKKQEHDGGGNCWLMKAGTHRRKHGLSRVNGSQIRLCLKIVRLTSRTLGLAACTGSHPGPMDIVASTRPSRTANLQTKGTGTWIKHCCSISTKLFRFNVRNFWVLRDKLVHLCVWKSNTP